MKREVTQAEVEKRKEDSKMALNRADEIDLDYITAEYIANEPVTIIEPDEDSLTAIGHHLRTGIVEGQLCWLIDSDPTGQESCGSFTLTLPWSRWLHIVDDKHCGDNRYELIGHFKRQSI